MKQSENPKQSKPAYVKSKGVPFMTQPKIPEKAPIKEMAEKLDNKVVDLSDDDEFY